MSTFITNFTTICISITCSYCDTAAWSTTDYFFGISVLESHNLCSLCNLCISLIMLTNKMLFKSMIVLDTSFGYYLSLLKIIKIKT